MTSDIKVCPICNGPVDNLIGLPALPLTGLYTTNPIPTVASYDTNFSYCSQCGHGLLGKQLDQYTIYDSSYTYRTSNSKYAIRGVDQFLFTLYNYDLRNNYGTILDIGCSDGYMLSRIAYRANKLVGIDAAATSKYSDVEVITDMVENVDLSSIHPDVILLRHTIEHIPDPVTTMRKIAGSMGPDTLLVVQTPMLDILVNDLRYDHIFHQHLQYFTISSMMKLLELVGLECVHYTFDRYEWGSIILIAKLGENSIESIPPTADYILGNYYRFTGAMNNISSIIDDTSNVVGYGAAQMLPTIAYHISSITKVKEVVDDDPSKDGMYYYNLPIRITNKLPDIHTTTFLVTGLDSSRVINKKLIDIGVDRIVNILSIT